MAALHPFIDNDISNRVAATGIISGPTQRNRRRAQRPGYRRGSFMNFRSGYWQQFP